MDFGTLSVSLIVRERNNFLVNFGGESEKVEAKKNPVEKAALNSAGSVRVRLSRVKSAS